MKRFYLFSLLLFAGLLSFAQQNVTLTINHMLGANAFQYGATAANNNGVEFNVTRCQYFVSEITLIHDGGVETIVPNTWMFVDAGQSSSLALGSFPITTLEGVKLGIGVQPAYNHLDPTTYAPGDPLALHSPSMHWGWSSGYIFAAMLGNSGPNFSNSWDVQGLDDANYYKATVNTAGMMMGQDLMIDLYADYEKALRNIDVSTGPTVHSGSGMARTMLQNFRDYVFSATMATGVTAPQLETFSIAPNPTAGHARLVVNAAANSTFIVYDYTGRILKMIQPVAGIADLNMDVAGCYLVALQQDGQIVATKRLVVAK